MLTIKMQKVMKMKTVYFLFPNLSFSYLLFYFLFLFDCESVTSEMNQQEKVVFRPFSLLVKTISKYVPRSEVEKTSKKIPKYEHSVLCSFFPKINEDDVDEVLGEFIFLIDRSGR